MCHFVFCREPKTIDINQNKCRTGNVDLDFLSLVPKKTVLRISPVVPHVQT